MKHKEKFWRIGTKHSNVNQYNRQIKRQFSCSIWEKENNVAVQIGFWDTYSFFYNINIHVRIDSIDYLIHNYFVRYLIRIDSYFRFVNKMSKRKFQSFRNTSASRRKCFRPNEAEEERKDRVWRNDVSTSAARVKKAM